MTNLVEQVAAKINVVRIRHELADSFEEEEEVLLEGSRSLITLIGNAKLDDALKIADELCDNVVHNSDYNTMYNRVRNAYVAIRSRKTEVGE